MRLLRSDEQEWESGKGYRKRKLVPEEILGIEGSFVQEVDFKRGEAVPSHYHRKTKEVFIALDPAHFVINGERITLMPDDALVCEPGDVHGSPAADHRSRILVIKVGAVQDDTVWVD